MDGSLVKGIDFKYSLSKMVLESITHDKENHRADFLIFITKLIRPLHKDIMLLGEPEKVEEKDVFVTIYGLKTLWTPDYLYKRAVEDAIRGQYLDLDPFDQVRSKPFSSPTEVQVYHNASFELSRNFSYNQTSRQVSRMDSFDTYLTRVENMVSKMAKGVRDFLHISRVGHEFVSDPYEDDEDYTQPRAQP